jgi:hypothetical protein
MSSFLLNIHEDFGSRPILMPPPALQATLNSGPAEQRRQSRPVLYKRTSTIQLPLSW